MTAAADVKLHPYLLTSLEAKRRELVLSLAESVIRLEQADERIEEREYDEQERLRRERIVSRRVLRGETRQRYATLVTRLQEGGARDEALKTAVGGQLDTDLAAIAAPATVAADLAGAVRRYGELMPSERWPSVLCIAEAPRDAAALERQLDALGCASRADALLRKFGILRFACPPELSVVRQLAANPQIHSIADPATPITLPQPMAVTTQVADARDILGVTPDMTQQFGDMATVAVLDTGVDLAHPALARIAPDDYRNFTNADDGDEEGHGTHVASIAGGDDAASGGRYSGVAPRCRLVAAKVISGTGYGDLESVLRGMAWAVFEKRADVMSLSIGDEMTPPNGRSIWTRACDEAYRQGTIVCVAAGNPDPSFPESIIVPGDAKTAVTVGAIDKARRLARFSAMGSDRLDSPLYGKPNCVAPGVAIVAARASASAYPPADGDTRHTPLSGTSMAAPAIAGCLALVKSKARSLGWEITPAELLDLFYTACRPLEDEKGESYSPDFEIGHGLVDMQEAFRLSEERAPAKVATAAVGTTRAPRSDPFAPGGSGEVHVPKLPPAVPVAFEPDVCYYCGRRYYTKVGTFSPIWKCDECGAPICAACWQIGKRRCEPHSRVPPPAPPVPPASAPAKRPAAEKRETVAMTPTDSEPEKPRASDKPQPEIDPRWGETFLNRFDRKISDTEWVPHPVVEVDLRVDKDAVQSFRRVFGDVRQFPLVSGLRVGRRHRLTLSAVVLGTGGLDGAGLRWQPRAEILKQVLDGLDCDEHTFYAVGVFSPVGWPADWKQHVEVRGNVHFYLVERGAGTSWRVFGPDDELRGFFDPEGDEEKKKRVEKALAERLILPGDLAPKAEFLEECGVSEGILSAVVEKSGGRYRIIEHKGRSAIQRAVV